MKKMQQKMLGVVGMLQMPATIEEFNSFCTGTDNVLTYGIAEAYYRNVAPKVRSKFLTAVELATGIAPRVRSVKKNAAGEDVEVLEKDTVYIKHVLTKTFPDGTAVTKEALAPILQAAFDEVGWVLSSTRQTGPNNKDRALCDSIINKIEAGSSTFEKVKASLENRNPGLVIDLEDDGTISEENLVEACRVDRIRREQADDII